MVKLYCCDEYKNTEDYDTYDDWKFCPYCGYKLSMNG
jgi:hypothetical protein